MSNGQKPVTRFAPSPTGFLHIGGVHRRARMLIYHRRVSRREVEASASVAMHLCKKRMQKLQHLQHKLLRQREPSPLPHMPFVQSS